MRSSIDGVSRSFGIGARRRRHHLDIEDGEFFTLLGPSGCGKTTLLRMIAGFCELDSGEIRFGEQAHRHAAAASAQHRHGVPELRDLPQPHRRRQRRLRAEGAQGCRQPRSPRGSSEALALVQLTGYGERWPHQLSGGQLQRVAIARALVIRPQVLLFDEPLSNLDARLRVSMRGEIRELQKSLGITAIYVTHDQEEAMSVSDRIALMNAGRLEQVGVPVDIYRHPVSRFAAEFMGTTNLVGGARARPQRRRVWVSLRPEALRFAAEAPAGWRGSCRNGRCGSRCWDRSSRLDVRAGRRHAAQGRDARCAASHAGAGRRRGDARLRPGAPDGRCREARRPASAAPAARHRGAGLPVPRRLPALSAVQRVRRQPARSRRRSAYPRQLRQDAGPAVLSRRHRQHAGHRRSRRR